MSARVLVCFALPLEAKPFKQPPGVRSEVRVLITGMGPRNALRSALQALREQRPIRVFTCGLAGALNPSLRIGDVIFQTTNALLAERLRAAGATAASFHCATRVAVTAAEKSALRQQTGTDAVEMESAVIQRVCAEADVPCATVRAISDLATEDLPLDFNKLMTRGQTMSGVKLAAAILMQPQRFPALLRLGRNSARAANELSHVLIATLQMS